MSMFKPSPRGPKNGHTPRVLIVCRISGCSKQKELSNQDQEDNAKEVACEIFEVFKDNIYFKIIATKGISDVSERLANRVQLTTDGNRVYVDAVENYMGGKVDYGMLVKHYGKTGDSPESRYSPGKCFGADKKQIDGNPDLAHVSTSYVERQNLNMRMKNRRFTRLTNAFSKKAINLAYSIALDFFHHNFIRIHQTLKMTPAMKAGISKYPMKIEDIVEMLPLKIASKRGPYKKHNSN